VSPWLSDLFLSSQSDERLAALAGAGHDRAFAAIVERYRGELHAHARRLSSDGRAEDIVQQAFLSAFAALRSGAEVRHLRGWLYQIVRNAAAKIHAPRDASLDELSITGAPLEDVAEARALALSALSEVGRLPDRQKQALVGTVQGRRRAEIANSMGLSEGAVRQLVHRARMSVRAAVTAVTPYPLLRWLAARSGSSAEIAFGAGAASASGATLKLGALLASGVIAGGIVVDVDRRAASHPSSGRTAVVQAHVRGSNGRGAAVAPSGPARRAVGALGGSLHGTLPAVLGRGGAAGARGHEVEHGEGGGGAGDNGHSGDGGSPGSGGASGPGHLSPGAPAVEGPTGSGGSGPDSGSGSKSGGSDSSSGGGGSTSDGGGSTSDGGGSTSDGGGSTSGGSGSTSGGSGSTSGGGGGSTRGDGESSGTSTTASTNSGSGNGGGTSGDGGGTSGTSGDPALSTTLSSSSSSDGTGGGGGTSGHGGRDDATSGRG
jgi:RNA polymerase sigma factor (sigma-70 family)